MKNNLHVFLGATVADAAARPLHWVYNQKKLLTYIKGKKDFTFLIKNKSPFYSIKTGRVSGYNAIGQVGNNTRGPDYSSPIQIGGDNWGKISSSGSSSQTMMVTKKDGTLWVWGRNDKGELGQNQNPGGTPGANARSSPTQVGTDTTWGAVDDEDGKMLTGYNVPMAIKTDGT